jgi:hypothetical protein
LLACDCERSNETTLTQAFTLISGDDLNGRIAQTGNRLERIAKSDITASEAVTELYWTALSRPPTAEELSSTVNAIESADRLTVLQDLAWALLNAKEFVFRR